MTIEKSPSPSANNANPTPSASRSDGKGKAGANDDGSGGFGAILSAVDNAPTPVAAPETASAADAGTDAAKGKSKTAKDAAAVDPNTLLQQNPQIAAAQAQAAADVAAAAAAAAAANGAPAQAAGTAQTAADPATLAQQAVLNASLPQQTAAEQPPATPLSTQLPNPAAARVRSAPVAADSTVALDTKASAAPATTQSLLQARAKAGKEALQAGLDTSASTSQAASTTQAAGSERADAAKFLASLQQAQNPQGNKALETVLAPLVAKSDKPQGERNGSSISGSKGTDPTYAGTALGVSGPDVSLGSTQQVNAVPPEMQVAEQVSYWVTHNVQNAELKLDGLGKDPVAVNISLQGNEAQISFRSDDAATRDMLQNSGAQLKDMLQREGLVLTGVSVGTSGSGGAQDRGEQGARQNVRQTQIAPLQVASQDSTPRLRSGMGNGTGRSVDLFV